MKHERLQETLFPQTIEDAIVFFLSYDNQLTKTYNCEMK